MNCPDKETIQDFVDGELLDEEVQSIAKHIRSCDTCKAQLQELFTFYSTLNHVVDKDRCPSLGMLKTFADNSSPQNQTEKIAEHIELCNKCNSLVWALQATQRDLDDWQEQEEAAFEEFQKKELGYDNVKDVLTKLLPSKIEMLEKSWQSALDLIDGLKTKAMDQWPSFGQQVQLVGVLGFEEYDPQTEAASIILLTILYISQEISEDRLRLDTEAIKDEIIKVSPKFGAGSELQKRLLEFVPPVILKSR